MHVLGVISIISLSGLNSPQQQAASTVEGPVLILAGAGSGKTRTITYRIAHMVDNLGIKGSEILGVSFTNKASKEMKERVTALLGKRKTRQITLSTFHSLGVKILKKEISHLGYYKNFSIYDTSDQQAIVREALKRYKAEKTFDRKIVLSKIGFLKNRGISAEDFEDSAYFNEEDPYDITVEYVYRYYQEKLLFYNAIDFDDILFLTVRLFSENPDIAKTYSEKFKYIMVDEYQDTNPLQFKLIMALTSTHDNLCVVGDDDQSIYGFRGADIANILNFEANFENATVIKLEQNYRSTSPILDLSNKVISENSKRREKTLWSSRKSDVIPRLWQMSETDHEALTVAEEILAHQSNGGHLGDIAILYRSNTQAPPVEDQLRAHQIPYALIGGQKFYEKKEVKDLIAYLCFIQNHKDELSLRRILNIPNRGIGKSTLDKFLAYSEENQATLFEALTENPDLAEARKDYIINFTTLVTEFKEIFKNNTLPEAITSLIEKINYLKYIDKQYDDIPKQAERRKNDVMMFVDSAERFQDANGQYATLKNYLERLQLQDNQDQEDLDEEDDDVRRNEVTLMTLHSAKGLEFHTVFLLGMEEQILPHKRSIEEGGLEEERRLCYVGITRAKEKLIMTYCKERKLYGKMTPCHPSRFVHELEKQNLIRIEDCSAFGHMDQQEAEKYKEDFWKNLKAGLE